MRFQRCAKDISLRWRGVTERASRLLAHAGRRAGIGGTDAARRRRLGERHAWQAEGRGAQDESSNHATSSRTACVVWTRARSNRRAPKRSQWLLARSEPTAPILTGGVKNPS
ncbi:hypothetical protein A176_003333 [Myxococcus hansupus]|uniref:Uncharacterized protein n=1 Tax=Pseudomyxococcus hansupus TaxID=1297742 RepID=A0A0H4WSG6_9BACT|nr:hypothetical protein A176_003333 [Myxococcus hansupus]